VGGVVNQGEMRNRGCSSDSQRRRSRGNKVDEKESSGSTIVVMIRVGKREGNKWAFSTTSLTMLLEGVAPSPSFAKWGSMVKAVLDLVRS